LKEVVTTMTEDQKQFVEHLEKVSREVAKWPEWKRNILGRSRVEAPATTGSFDPPMTGLVMGCSTEVQPAPDAGQSQEAQPPTASVLSTSTPGSRTDGSVPAATPPATNGCRYNWVGDRMRERLDALEKERPNCPQLNILDP
jgi:hypothetical protein